MLKTGFNLNFLLGDAQIGAIRVGQPQVDIGHFLNDDVFYVQIFVAVVEYFEICSTLNIQWHSWHQQIWSVEDDAREIAACLDVNADVAARKLHFGLVDEESYLLGVFSPCRRVKGQLDRNSLEGLNDSLGRLKTKWAYVLVSNPPLQLLVGWIGQVDLLVFTQSLFALNNDSLKVNLFGVDHQLICDAFADCQFFQFRQVVWQASNS